MTTGILGSFQTPMDKADYMGHCFKSPTTQVHCRAEQRSSFFLTDFTVQGIMWPSKGHNLVSWGSFSRWEN